MIMDYASEIKSRLTTKEVFLHYGFEPNRMGEICCPFHSEKTPSLKIYDGDRGWTCFGCHKGGDAINFVREYFGLNFKDAIAKINTDFFLGLPIGHKIDRRKQLEMGRIAFERKRKAEQQQKERQQIDDDYWTAFEEWKRLDDNKRNYAPKSPTEPLHPLFVEALKNIAGAEYNLSCAEIARCEYENRNSRDS